jgi:HAD superfamily hydrolase (TIGR01509 family)
VTDDGALILDLDGVLIDSEPVWEQVRRGVVREYGGRWPHEAQGLLMGMSTPEWARYLAEDLGVGLSARDVARTVIDGMVARYAVHVPLLPGADAAVRHLAERWRLGLASSSPRRLIDVLLEAMGWSELFPVSVSTEEVPRGKPAPDCYLEAARRLGVEPAACIAVEDSSNGLRAATAAGMRLIAMPRPEYPPDPDALAPAVLVLDEGIASLTPEVVERAAAAPAR